MVASFKKFALIIQMYCNVAMASPDQKHWEVENSITFFSQGEHDGAHFIYEVRPPIADIEYRVLISTGLMLGASVDGSDIDLEGESIVEPLPMENHEDGKPVSTPLKVAGGSDPLKRIRNLDKIAGALTVMRNGPVEIIFDDEAQRLSTP